MATSHTPDIATSSRGYHPYLICSSSPNKSGQERDEEIQQILRDTPDVSPTDYYSRGGLNFVNNDTLSCGAYRAYNDTFSKVYVSSQNDNNNSAIVDWMTVNPLHSSMKMAQYTVDTMMSWFIKGETSGDVVSIGGETGMEDTMQVKILGLHMILCPGVQNFGGDNGSDVDVPDDDIANDIKAFVTENGGTTVKELSFYHHRVEEDMDGADAIYSERMGQWSKAVTTVTNWTNPDDGSNPCLDTVIRDGMNFIVNEQGLEVSAKLSFLEGDELAQSLGFQQEDVETCIWYMTYALAVNPMVCWVEPRTKVKTLCKDGSDDLANCTSSPAPPAPTPPPSSSSSNWIGTTKRSSSLGIVASMAVLIMLGVDNFLF